MDMPAPSADTLMPSSDLRAASNARASGIISTRFILHEIVRRISTEERSAGQFAQNAVFEGRGSRSNASERRFKDGGSGLIALSRYTPTL